MVSNVFVCIVIFLSFINAGVMVDLYTKDAMALSTCTAASGPAMGYHRVVAARRGCTSGQQCHTICKGIDPTYNCFDALHLYTRATITHLMAYRFYYSGCSHTTCGPNYCCCGK